MTYSNYRVIKLLAYCLTKCTVTSEKREYSEFLSVMFDVIFFSSVAVQRKTREKFTFTTVVAVIRHCIHLTFTLNQSLSSRYCNFTNLHTNRAKITVDNVLSYIVELGNNF